MIRVASVPSAHPYVQAIFDSPFPDAAAVVGASDHPGAPMRTLADPAPVGGPREDGVWWPPGMLQAGWVGDHHRAFDVMHVHFGFEGIAIADLRATVGALREAGRPLVCTVHDLTNPHLLDQGGHEERLDVLVPAADAVVTLTARAGAEIRRRWGVEAEIIPHPPIAPTGRIGRADHEPAAGPSCEVRPVRGRSPRVGMHLKSLRANTDPSPYLAELAEAVGGLGGTLEISVHPGILDRPERAEVTAAVAAVAAVADRTGVVVRQHPRLSDAALYDELAGLDVAVLPYRFGTHSGWLELCWDLGTRVLAPNVGYFAEQHPDPGFIAVFDPGHPGSITSALDRLLAQPHFRPDRCARAGQKARVATAHRALYQRVLARQVAA